MLKKLAFSVGPHYDPCQLRSGQNLKHESFWFVKALFINALCCCFSHIPISSKSFDKFLNFTSVSCDFIFFGI